MVSDVETQSTMESVDSFVSTLYVNVPILSTISNERDLKKYVRTGSKRLVEPAIAKVSDFFLSLPSFFLGLFFFSASLFYFISDSKIIYKFIKDLKFVDHHELMRTMRMVQLSCQSTMFAAFVTGLVQSMILTVTSVAIGINYFFTVFFVTFFFAQIPLVGTAPITLGLLIYAYKGDDNLGLVLVIIAGILAGFIDNIIRAWTLSRYDSLHPLAGLIASIGALVVFGPVGVFLGPVVTLLFIKVLKEEYEEPASVEPEKV